MSSPCACRVVPPARRAGGTRTLRKLGKRLGLKRETSSRFRFYLLTHTCWSISVLNLLSCQSTTQSTTHHTLYTMGIDDHDTFTRLTQLQAAAADGNVDKVVELLDAGADANIQANGEVRGDDD